MINFTRKKYTHPEGDPRTRYIIDVGPEFYMEASRKGIKLFGELEIRSEDELETFAKTMSDALVDFQKYTPRIVSTLSGH